MTLFFEHTKKSLAPKLMVMYARSLSIFFLGIFCQRLSLNERSIGTAGGEKRAAFIESSTSLWWRKVNWMEGNAQRGEGETIDISLEKLLSCILFSRFEWLSGLTPSENSCYIWSYLFFSYLYVLFQLQSYIDFSETNHLLWLSTTYSFLLALSFDCRLMAWGMLASSSSQGCKCLDTRVCTHNEIVCSFERRKEHAPSGSLEKVHYLITHVYPRV